MTVPQQTRVDWPRWRPRMVDKRTRAYRRWAERRARLVKSMGRVPNEVENELLDLLTDRLLDADARRGARHRGRPIDHDDSRVASEIRRMMVTLGLVGGASESEAEGLGGLL